MPAVRHESLDRGASISQDLIYPFLRRNTADATALIFSIGNDVGYALDADYIRNHLHVIG
ncbi:hypothetical protein ASZ90_012663 [hydrocarbon metagenome]|uniref:Uncharacterized protein n=1 Tax=hydrocarbon metagenome TaxID=938273 RepID=A0A0W8F9S6_9ZZZZ